MLFFRFVQNIDDNIHLFLFCSEEAISDELHPLVCLSAKTGTFLFVNLIVMLLFCCSLLDGIFGKVNGSGWTAYVL